MANKELHFKCRGSAIRNLADVLHHVNRSHSMPNVFCVMCLEKFKSDDDLRTHSYWCSQARPFQCNWAWKDNLDAVKKLRKKWDRQIKPRWDGVAWLDMFDTLFAGSEHQPRRPVFCTVIAQDVADVWSDFVQSEYGGPKAEAMSDKLLKYLRKMERSSLHSARTSDGSPRPNFLLGSSPSVQQPAMSQPAPGVVPGPDTRVLPVSLNAQRIISPVPAHGSHEVSGPMMDPSPFSAQDFGQNSGFGFAEPETTPLQYIEHAPESTYLHHVANHVTSPGPMSQAASQVFSHSFPNSQPTLASQVVAGSFGQGFAMPTLTQALPLQPALPSQMFSTAQGSQAAPPGMLTGPNPGHWGPYVGWDGASAPPPDSQNRRW